MCQLETHQHAGGKRLSLACAIPRTLQGQPEPEQRPGAALKSAPELERFLVSSFDGWGMNAGRSLMVGGKIASQSVRAVQAPDRSEKLATEAAWHVK